MDLVERLTDISWRHKLSHLGSCLTALPILEYIYKAKNPEDLVVLSAGHAGMALYVVLEKYEGHDAEELLEAHGIHPCRDPARGIHVTSGSLGTAVCVAVGLARADPTRRVHVVLSDGECAEGSVWEALAFARKAGLENLIVHVNINGYSAYESVSSWNLALRLKAFYWPVRIWFTRPPPVSFLKGLQAHYHVMTEEHKDEMLKYINEERLRQDPSQSYEQKFKDFLDYGRSRLWSAGRYLSGLSESLYKRRSE